MNVIGFFEDVLPVLEVSVGYPVPTTLSGEALELASDPDETNEQRMVSASNITTLYIQTSLGVAHTGQLTLTNRGGGLLSGRIQAEAGLEFSTTQFQKNHLSITYTLTANVQAREQSATVLTNGGAYRLVFVTEQVPQALIIQGEKLRDLKAFYTFSQNNPRIAKGVFLKQEFGYWLTAIDYAHVPVYEQLRQDPNRERGFDNFWIFNEFKSPAKVTLQNDRQHFDINPFTNDDYQGTLTLSLDSPGHIDQALIASHPAIRLDRERVSTTDFKHTGELSVGYSIDKNWLDDPLCEATITLTDCEGLVHITTRKLAPVVIELSPNHCTIKDTMTLTITNNTSKPIKIDVTPSDNFVKVDTFSYMVTDTLEIPVHVRLSKLMQARKTMKKQHIFTSVLKVSAHLRDKRIYKDIQLTVGDF